MATRWRRRDVILVACAVLLALPLAGHRLLPGVVLVSFLPWLGVPVVLLGVTALGLRSRAGALAALLPVLAWAVLFGPTMLGGPSGGRGDLLVATQNLGAGNGAAAAELAATGADLVAVQELTARARPAVSAAFEPRLPHSAVVGTVGLWSRFPVTGVRGLDLAQGWARALTARVALPSGEVTVYAVHLASIRLGDSAARDRALTALADRVRADPAQRVLVLGDLNTASTDRRLADLTGTVPEVRSGFGFTWPAAFPLTRPDHILARGLPAVDASVLPTSGSDHHAALATFRTGGG